MFYTFVPTFSNSINRTSLVVSSRWSLQSSLFLRIHVGDSGMRESTERKHTDINAGVPKRYGSISACPNKKELPITAPATCPTEPFKKALSCQFSVKSGLSCKYDLVTCVITNILVLKRSIDFCNCHVLFCPVICVGVYKIFK